MITGRTFTHITLAEIKKQLRIHENFTEDDSFLLSLLQVSTDLAANYIDNVIALTSFQKIHVDFNDSHIFIEEGNLDSVESITYLNGSGEEIELPASDYTVKTTVLKLGSIIRLKNNLQTSKLTVNYKCGFTDITIPSLIKQAILIKVCDLYDIERSTYISNSFKENKAFETLLNYHRKINFL